MKQINKNVVENTLWPEDEALFLKMDNNYISINERLFFETIREKMLTELAPCSELLLSEVSNTDEVYLLRTQYDEFIVGQGKGEFRKDEVHTMNLSEALNIDMKANGFLPDAISFFEWLRKIDYRGLQYNHNYAYL